ncbi:unnamed protein product [Musa acuminata subsp. burmannicoides]
MCFLFLFPRKNRAFFWLGRDNGFCNRQGSPQPLPCHRLGVSPV